MNGQRQVIVRDLVEEAKKRIVVVIICIVGLSYLMSLTSSSVWVNLPAAASLIILLRYFTLDYDMRRKAASYSTKPTSTVTMSSNKSRDSNTRMVDRSDWRRKINSPVVEEAIDHFTRHLVSEWVTDLWYFKLTPDRQGPEELVRIINGVIGELSCRLRNINLIDLLTRDIIGLVCTHLERFRAAQAKIDKQLSDISDIEQRDKEIRLILATENKLHPALFSAEAEHKVLQHIMEGLISLIFRQEDLQCSFFRYISRELLASAVMRPILNLANPRFINERIEIFVISKTNKGAVPSQESSHAKSNGSSRIPSDHFAKFLDPTVTGVELVQLKNDHSRNGASTSEAANLNGNPNSKDPLLSMDPRSTHSWNSLPLNSQISNQGVIRRHESVGKWGELLDVISERKNAALAPENFENMWTKGREYKKPEGKRGLIEQVPQITSSSRSTGADHVKRTLKPKEREVATKIDAPSGQSISAGRTGKFSVEKQRQCTNQTVSKNSLLAPFVEDDEIGSQHADESESGSSTSYTSEEVDPHSITGLGSPGTKVWDGKTNRHSAVSHIHHPLESHAGRNRKKIGRGISHYRQLHRTQSGRKRSRTSAQNVLIWQEVERTSFFSGDGQDILRLQGDTRRDDSSTDSEIESLSRVYSGAAASSSASHSSTMNSLKNSLMVDSFYKLKCEVLGANIVKSGSKTFAVYSLSVTDVNNNTWSIKRRFRHFEELHRRLKEYAGYSLHLPPKHFLSTGLDIYVIKERCKLLDQYLKELLQLPTISGSIEVWDFLSVDSQTYLFSNSFSIIETLSVNLDDNPSEKSHMGSNALDPSMGSFATVGEQLTREHRESAVHKKNNFGADVASTSTKDASNSPGEMLSGEPRKSFEDSGSDPDTRRNHSSVKNLGRILKGRNRDGLDHSSEAHPNDFVGSSLPEEWVPPNVTLPILNLVDVILQLQEGGWIRRKAFWVVKQILQLGMGDALDDWLLEKIQLLRRGTVVASLVSRVEQILWPDGIFITKHPKRRPQPTSNSTPGSPSCPQPTTSMSSPRPGPQPATSMSSPRPGPQPTSMSSPRPGPQPTSMSSPRPGPQPLTEEQQQEAGRRAKFVYELMIDNAPAGIVGLVGRKEYEHCSKDLYFYIQSMVCLKQLSFELLELLLLSAFPEMDYIFRQLHEEKHRFGEFIPS